MAIVKVKYTRSRPGIKKHLRYIVHRPGKEQETITRPMFREQYRRADKYDAYALINYAPKGTMFYKFIINFDPKKEDRNKDLDIQHITSETFRAMGRLIGRDVPFIATIHDDHTPLRHIHAIGLVQGRLAKAAFAKLKTLRLVATQEARAQRRRRDQAQEQRQGRFLTQARFYRQPVRGHSRYRVAKPVRMQHGCDTCGNGQITEIFGWRQYCPVCRAPLHQEQTVSLDLSLQR